MNKHQKYLFILLVVCCSLAIMRRLFTEAYEEGETEDEMSLEKGETEDEMSLEKGETEDEMSLEEPIYNISYDKVDCEGHFEDISCPGYCGYEGGNVVNKWITKVNSQHGGKECPENEVLECPATDPCPVNCEGYHEESPFCPSYCGYEGGAVTRKWVTTKEPNQTGEACPIDMEVDCPASDTCISVKSVMKF